MGIDFDKWLCYNKKSMERIIRNILNFRPDNATDVERDSLTADILAASVYLLQKTGRFNPPNSLNAISREMVGGSFGNNTMYLSTNMFKSQSNYLNDLTILSHEACHLGQGYNVDESKNFSTQKNMICNSTHFSVLNYLIAIFQFPHTRSFIDMYGLDAVSSFYSGLNDLHLFFRSFYELQSFEMEANDFSLEFVKFIIKEAKKLNLSKREQEQLNYLIGGMKQTNAFYETRKKMISLRQNKSFLKIMENYCIDAFDRLLKMSPEFCSAIKGNKAIKISEGTELDTAVNAACQIFEITYSEKYVSRLMDVLLKSPQNNNRDFYIFSLLCWTEYKPNKKQEEAIKNIFNSTKVEFGEIDYDMFIKEKNRIAEERRSIKQGNVGKISSFNF